MLATKSSIRYPPFMNRHAVVLALLSAALFGVSTSAAKALLGAVDPSVLAGLLYCGAGIGVAILRRLSKPLLAPSAAVEAPLGPADMCSQRTLARPQKAQSPAAIRRDPVAAATWPLDLDLARKVIVYCAHGEERSQASQRLCGGFRIPWLIRRFIDPDARFIYVPATDVLKVAKDTGAIPYDIPGVTRTHRGERCSFDALIEDCHLTDPKRSAGLQRSSGVPIP